MKLYYAPASPYVRKVMILLHETGLEPGVERISSATTPMKSDTNMDVQVRVLSPKLRFTKSAAIIRVPANGSSELVVDVVALSNGLFPVEIRIFTADGLSQLGKKVEVSARVNAIAGLGQVVSVVALLLLVTWWVAHIRRKYRKQISKNHPVLRSKP